VPHAPTRREEATVAKDETVTLTRADLDALISTAVSSAVAAVQAAAPKPVGPNAELVAEMDRLERGRAALTKELAPKGYAHKSRTGATMVLRVVASRDPKFPHGRIVALEPYQFPAGYEDTEGNGGIAPAPRYHKDGRENIVWQRWAWGIRKADLNMYVGQPYEPWMANLEAAAAAE
jgi:hypothetical protein